MPHLTHTVADGIADVVLNNPPQNRIDRQMADELAAATEDITRRNARAVLLRAGGPDFCFGGDIVDWPDLSTAELGLFSSTTWMSSTPSNGSPSR